MEIKNLIAHIKAEVKFENKNTLWDFVKCDIRSHTILYSSKKAKQEAIVEKELTSKLNSLEQNITESGKENLTEYLDLKSKWENLLKKRHLGVVTRSKAKWVEEGEKNTKYFLNLEKRNFNNKYIRKLISKDNQEITSLKDIINEEVRFYQDLYTSKINDKNVQNEEQYFLEKNKLPGLSDIDKIMCDEPLTMEEITKALKLLPNNKSPGSDGFTTNFYKFFWIDIKDLLFDSFKYSFAHGTLSNEQKRGVLNLIPKPQKDLRYLSNWRPVSLLQTDYKILTKTLALRLQNVLPNIINIDQVGYIPNRYIGKNIRTIKDIMTYSLSHKIPGFIALIDFQKAFDSIEWHFMFKCLSHFNFGNNFIQWIKLLYTDISSCVGNNGFYSNYFKLSRGIIQGCPISALLFLLVAEVIAIHIRDNSEIKGIKVGDSEVKIKMLADDTTLLLEDLSSVTLAIKDFDKFSKCSGLNLNLQKTENIPIGSNIHKQIGKTVYGIKLKEGPFKTLGIWFSNNDIEMKDLNFNERIGKMKKQLDIWRSRNLSLKGKITIMKSLILPQILFLFKLIFVPKNVLDQIDDLFFIFCGMGNLQR